MKVTLLAAMVVVAAGVGAGASSPQDEGGDAPFTVHVCAECEGQQRFRGFGTSLCWWANGVGQWRNASAFGDVMRLIFSATDGLGLSTVRYNIGGGEHPQNAHFLRPGAFVRGFQHADGSYNWHADYSQRRVLAAAMNSSVELVQAFSNSPPYWMTNSGSVTGAHGGGNNLRADMFEAFASYLANVTLALRSGSSGGSGGSGGKESSAMSQAPTDGWLPLGDALVAVTPLNEPASPWWKYGNNQEGCHFDRDKQRSIVRALKARLQHAAGRRTGGGRSGGLGAGVGVAGPEENSIDDSLLSLLRYGNKTVDADMDLLTTHTYNGEARRALASFARAHNKPLWNSEYGTGSGPLQGGLQLGQRIVQDLNELNPSVWTLWQAVDLDNNLSANGWGLVAATAHEENLYQIVVSSTGAASLAQTQVDARPQTAKAATVSTTCCLEVEDMMDGGNITCSACDVNNPNQVFSIVDERIRAGNKSGLCLDDWGQAARPGDRVRLYSCWGGNNQAWQLDEAKHELWLANTKLCLDVQPSVASESHKMAANNNNSNNNSNNNNNNNNNNNSDDDNDDNDDNNNSSSSSSSTGPWYESSLRTVLRECEDGVGPGARAPGLQSTLNSNHHALRVRSVLDDPFFIPRDGVREAYRVRKQYWAYMQFTQALRPNSTLLPTSITDDGSPGLVGDGGCDRRRSSAAAFPTTDDGWERKNDDGDEGRKGKSHERRKRSNFDSSRNSTDSTDNGGGGISAVAGRLANGTVAVVLVNADAMARNGTVSLSGYTGLAGCQGSAAARGSDSTTDPGMMTMWAFVTDAHRSFAPFPLTNQREAGNHHHHSNKHAQSRRDHRKRRIEGEARAARSRERVSLTLPPHAILSLFFTATSSCDV